MIAKKNKLQALSLQKSKKNTVMNNALQCYRYIFSFLFSLILCLFLAVPVKANHVLGADITYKNIGKDSFLVNVSAYIDCGPGSSFKPMGIFMKTACGGGRIILVIETVSTQDITPFCESACNKCSDKSCTYGFGLQKIVIQAIADVSKYDCCEFTFSWENCCLPTSITTGAGGAVFYTEAFLNKCISGGHSSPEFLQEPIALLAVNNCVSRMQSVTINTGDSLVYKLTYPLSKSGWNVTYSYGYSNLAPLKYAGYPDRDKEFEPLKCYGFHFNSQTGELNFKPVEQEVSVLAFLVEQWQKDSAGVYRKAGAIRRTNVVTVIDNSSNRQPVLREFASEKNTFYVCAGNTLSFRTHSFDADNDSLKVTWLSNIKNAKITSSPGKFPAIDFTWKTGKENVSDKPYFFSVNANDGYCPLPGENQINYKIYVVDDSLPKITLKSDRTSCNSYSFTASTDSANDKITYLWYINNALAAKTRTFKKVFPATGIYAVRLMAKQGCTEFFTDTVIIQSVPSAERKTNHFICLGDSVKLEAKGGHLYKWESAEPVNGNTASATVFVSPLKTAYYYVSITDTVYNCTTRDSVFVQVTNDCVWPGDANKDGIVDYKDILHIGVGYGVKGKARADTSAAWQPNKTMHWWKFAANEIDYVHFDADGNGIINAADTAVVAKNYGKKRLTNFKTIPVNDGEKHVYFSFDKDTFYAGDKITARLKLGKPDLPVYNAYGLSYAYIYANTKVVANSNTLIPLCDALCADNSFMLNFSRFSSKKNTGEISQVRTDHKNTIANGDVAVFASQLLDSTHNYREEGEWIYLMLKDVKLIDASGEEYVTNIAGDSALILPKKKANIGLNDLAVKTAEINIFPNPASGYINIQSTKHFFDKVYMVNSLGQQVKVFSFPHNNSELLDVSNLPKGVYFLQLMSGSKLVLSRSVMLK